MNQILSSLGVDVQDETTAQHYVLKEKLSSSIDFNMGNKDIEIPTIKDKGLLPSLSIKFINKLKDEIISETLNSTKNSPDYIISMLKLRFFESIIYPTYDTAQNIEEGELEYDIDDINGKHGHDKLLNISSNYLDPSYNPSSPKNNRRAVIKISSYPDQMISKKNYKDFYDVNEENNNHIQKEIVAMTLDRECKILQEEAKYNNDHTDINKNSITGIIETIAAKNINKKLTRKSKQNHDKYNSIHNEDINNNNNNENNNNPIQLPSILSSRYSRKCKNKKKNMYREISDGSSSSSSDESIQLPSKKSKYSHSSNNDSLRKKEKKKKKGNTINAVNAEDSYNSSDANLSEELDDNESTSDENVNEVDDKDDDLFEKEININQKNNKNEYNIIILNDDWDDNGFIDRISQYDNSNNNVELKYFGGEVDLNVWQLLHPYQQIGYIYIYI